jgi:non-ribosomal peptide synthetase component F
MLALQNTPAGGIELPGLSMQTVGSEQTSAKFELTLTIEEIPDGLECAFEYNTDLFDATTIARMESHFARLLEAIVADPACRLMDLPMLAEQERHRLLVGWNDTRMDYAKGRTVHQLFEEQAQKAPDAVAVAYADEHVSYRELNERANRLAHYLTTRGVGPDVLVAIRIERGIDMMIALFGVLKAGGAYVALDPAYPQARLAYMLDDAAPAVLLTQQHLLASTPGATDRMSIFCIDSQWPELAHHSVANADIALRPGNLAYVIYTSGSTGRPKGVLSATTV